MRFDVVTLFPELFEAPLAHGVTRRAYGSGAVAVRTWQLRQFGEGPHQRVDDRPYGGGQGMVLLVEPLVKALAAVRAERPDAGVGVPVVHFSPSGERLTQARVAQLGAGPGAILVCGRYEGIDQRFLDACVDLELSLGDYVLSGGELPALVLLDAVARLVPGTLGDPRSPADESFSAGLLEGPHYSRPERLPEPLAPGHDAAVPDVLLSGHHGRIDRWRREQALAVTAARRPELLAALDRDGALDADDRAWLASHGAAVRGRL